MPRPSRVDDRRRELLPIVTRAFAELGYRRATTAEIASRCGVRENILYRLWADKKLMFLAAIDHVYAATIDIWQARIAEAGDGSGALALLDYESGHLGEFGQYRIIFTGLAEADDRDIRRALGELFSRLQRFLARLVARHRKASGAKASLPDDLVAWTIVGLGTAVNIGRELDLFRAKQRSELLGRATRALLDA